MLELFVGEMRYKYDSGNVEQIIMVVKTHGFLVWEMEGPSDVRN